VLFTDFPLKVSKVEGLSSSYFCASVQVKEIKESKCIPMNFDFYIAAWFRSHSLPLCEKSLSINFLTGYYSLYNVGFYRYGKLVIDLLRREVERI